MLVRGVWGWGGLRKIWRQHIGEAPLADKCWQGRGRRGKNSQKFADIICEQSFSNTRDFRTYCFKYLQVYILIHLYQNQERETKLNYFQRFLKYIKCWKDFNTLKLYTLRALLSKNWLSFFFLIFQYAKIPPSIGMLRYWHQFFTYLFLSSFAFFKFNTFDKIAAFIKLKIKRNILDKKAF